MRRQLTGVITALLAACILLLSQASEAARISDIRNTKHNFSATVAPTDPDSSGATRVAQASSESQICAFCHTPHHATQDAVPIWNRTLSSATYIPFSSTSIEATDLGQPGGKSKLCLSCHDGTIAIGQVNVLNRQPDSSTQSTQINMTGTMPDGTIREGDEGVTTGFTRRLGVDLTNDHPISFTFDSAQAARDGELWDPSTALHVGNRSPGVKPSIVIENDKVECVSCHDPHMRDNEPDLNNKFLRANRFQGPQPPIDNSFDPDNDIICIGCHNKAGWVGSAHASPLAGNERYTEAAAELREFPRDTQVWEAACLNCHDPHTVQGSRRLLREGTDGPQSVTPMGAKFRQGGSPAVEEVCFACHSSDGDVLTGQGSTQFEVPDIKTDFTTMLRGMPIASLDQAARTEMHSIGTGDSSQGLQRGQDFIEDPENLGKGNLNNRHAECTDCHNPHRVSKNRLFNADNTFPDAAGTHEHTDGVPHTNLASGVLRGIWGVEPVYGNTAFGSNPVAFEVKRGDPGTGGSTDVSAPYLTREYQLCMKCHSNYSYDEPPLLGSFRGGTPPGTNSLFRYTNQAMEYQSPDDHMGEGTSGSPSGAFQGLANAGTANPADDYAVDYQVTNHRSWHPALKPTGRTPSVRSGGNTTVQNVWRPPFDAAVGTQTMYCTDCHGSTTAPDTVVPIGGEDGQVWGPHGSNDNFLLKGAWDDQTGRFRDDHLCFRCHRYDAYGMTRPFSGGAFQPTPPVRPSGFKVFSGGGGSIPFMLENLHIGHAVRVTNFRCTYCHVAIPHGWKNKVFLANLNDVGLEAPLLPGEVPNAQGVRQVRYNPDPASVLLAPRYYNGPYYNGAVLKVDTFSTSGTWDPNNCGSSGLPGNGQVGSALWMNGGTEACLNPP